jgi:hypothetical protein
MGLVYPAWEHPMFETLRQDEQGTMVEWHWQWEINVLEEHVSQYKSNHHKSQADWPKIEPRLPRWDAGE